MDPEVKEEGGLDIDAGVAEIVSGMGFDNQEPIEDDPAADLDADPIAPAPDKPVVAEPVVRAAPKSWSKEKHEVWSKMPPEAQEQVELREKQMLEGLESYKADSGLGRQMRETITPYKALLASQGVDEIKAVQVLMNAHYKLSTLPAHERNAYFAGLAQTYGVDLSQAQVAPQTPADPRVKSLEDQVAKLTNNMTESQQRAFEAHRAKVSNDVNSFANAKDDKGNPVNPYFDEVADDIIVFINAGMSLDEAYKRAVRSNPVTFEKEAARLKQEAQAQLREKGKKEAEAARKAASTNVRSRDTRRAPTEPMGKMEDTMRETLADIKARAH